MSDMKGKKTFALMLGKNSLKREHGIESGHAELTVVEIDVSNGNIRNPELGSEFNDVVLYCQWSDKYGADPFAFSLEYRSVYSIGLGEAKRMAKFLARADRAEKKFAVHPVTFGQFCSLMASGLGIKKLVKYVGGNGPSFNDNEYRTFSLTEAQRVIDAAIAEARKVEEVA